VAAGPGLVCLRQCGCDCDFDCGCDCDTDCDYDCDTDCDYDCDCDCDCDYDCNCVVPTSLALARWESSGPAERPTACLPWLRCLLLLAVLVPCCAPAVCLTASSRTRVWSTGTCCFPGKQHRQLATPTTRSATSFPLGSSALPVWKCVLAPWNSLLSLPERALHSPGQLALQGRTVGVGRFC